MSNKVSASDFSGVVSSLARSREKLAVVAGGSRLIDDFFEEVAAASATFSCELNARLAEKLMPLAPPSRSRRAIEFVRSILGSGQETVVFVKKIEVLFHPALRVNPLSLLKTLSMEKTLVIRWPGEFLNGCLTYAYPQHVEFFSSKPDYLPVVHASGSNIYLTFAQ